MDNNLLTSEQPETVNRLREEPDMTAPPTRELDVGERIEPVHVTLEPPVTFDGKSYSELNFDFESLIGKDFLRAEREFTHRYKPEKNEVVIPEMKQLYRVILAAHNANVPVELVQKLPGRYYNAVINAVLKLYGNSPEQEA